LIRDCIVNRREFVGQVAGLMVTGGWAGRLLPRMPLFRLPPTPMTIYKSSTCGCCAKWVDYVGANGFSTTVHDQTDMDRIKDQLGVPQAVRSCHTAVVDKYLIEGHMPAADIRRLLAERPKVMGLAVPGMPPRSPGMAGPGESVGGFEVIAFQPDGATQTFSRY
jgi:hypothetical protein